MIPCHDGMAKTLVRLLEEERVGWRNSTVVGVMTIEGVAEWYGGWNRTVGVWGENRTWEESTHYRVESLWRWGSGWKSVRVDVRYARSLRPHLDLVIVTFRPRPLPAKTCACVRAVVHSLLHSRDLPALAFALTWRVQNTPRSFHNPPPTPTRRVPPPSHYFILYNHFSSWLQGEDVAGVHRRSIPLCYGH